MMDIFSELNAKQIEAVKATEGPVLVLAGAGSGKTKTLTHRIAYLIDERGVPAHGVLAVTFTNKAAGEMRQRAAKLLRQNPNTWQTWRGFKSAPALGTFHSVCVRILREEIGKLGYSQNFVIYDDYDQKKAIKAVMEQNGVSVREVSVGTVQAMIGRAKNELLSVDELLAQAFGPAQKMAAELYDSYQNFLKKSNALDFDDLLGKTVELFRNFPETLESYRQRWPYIMIDEYQDTNHAQYIWARLLAGEKKNIFVVGDDWQGIYSWRGATIRNILEFEKDFPGARVIALEQNYRSPAEIVELGNAIISGNRGQMKKKLWTDRISEQLPQALQAMDETHEAEMVLEKIAELEELVGSSRPSNPHPRLFGGRTTLSLEGRGEDAEDEITYDYEAEGNKPTGILDKILSKMRGVDPYARSKPVPVIASRVPPDIGEQKINWNNYAVLYRTNAQSRVLEEVLLKYGVPYRLIGGVRFYARKEIKDTLAYLRVLQNNDDYISLSRIINEPARGIGEKTLTNVYKQAAQQKKSLLKMMSSADEIGGISPSRAQALKQFAHVFSRAENKINELSVIELIDLLLDRSGYIDYLKAQTEAGEERLENIGELKNVAKKFDHLRGREGLFAFLEEVSLIADIDNYNPAEGQALTLMTLHSAKGLEFETVFIVGLEEGLLPHSNSIIDPQELEEERRLCYVGITRAKNNLFFIYTRQRTLYGSISGTMPSRFLSEMGKGVDILENRK